MFVLSDGNRTVVSRDMRGFKQRDRDENKAMVKVAAVDVPAAVTGTRAALAPVVPIVRGGFEGMEESIRKHPSVRAPGDETRVVTTWTVCRTLVLGKGHDNEISAL